MATEVEKIVIHEVESHVPQICPYSDDTGESLIHLELRLQANSERISKE